MRITALTYTAQSSNEVLVSWTGTSDYMSWVFVNGAMVDGPLVFDTTACSCVVTLAANEVAAIEVHETADEIAPEACMPAPITKPWIDWTPAENADSYLVYRKRVGGNEYLIITTAHDDETAIYEERCPRGLGEGWHLFRVEGATDAGAESVRTPWAARIYNLPPEPDGLSVSGSGGMFNICIFPHISRYLQLASNLSLA